MQGARYRQTRKRSDRSSEEGPKIRHGTPRGKETNGDSGAARHTRSKAHVLPLFQLNFQVFSPYKKPVHPPNRVHGLQQHDAHAIASTVQPHEYTHNSRTSSSSNAMNIQQQQHGWCRRNINYNGEMATRTPTPPTAAAKKPSAATATTARQHQHVRGNSMAVGAPLAHRRLICEADETEAPTSALCVPLNAR